MTTIRRRPVCGVGDLWITSSRLDCDLSSGKRATNSLTATMRVYFFRLFWGVGVYSGQSCIYLGALEEDPCSWLGALGSIFRIKLIGASKVFELSRDEAGEEGALVWACVRSLTVLS